MISRTTNKKDIARVINHPKVYEMVSDDLSPKPYVPAEGNIFLMDDKKLGVVELDSINGITCMIHIATMPKLWGKADGFINEVLSWIFTNTSYMKIIAFIPSFNRPTIRIAEKSGMEKEGCIKKSFLKNWRLWDQMIYGLTKESFKKKSFKEALCRQQQQQQQQVVL